MDWIFDHFQILALIGLALASWLKHRMDQKRAAQEEGRPPAEMTDDEDVFGPGEGWPPPLPQVPPPLVRQVPPPLAREHPSQPLETRPHAAILQQQLEIQERLRQIRETKVTTTGGAAATRTRVSAAQSHAKAAQPVKAGVRGMLRSRREIRRAVVLREILGPPVGLR